MAEVLIGVLGTTLNCTAGTGSVDITSPLTGATVHPTFEAHGTFVNPPTTAVNNCTIRGHPGAPDAAPFQEFHFRFSNSPTGPNLPLVATGHPDGSTDRECITVLEDAPPPKGGEWYPPPAQRIAGRTGWRSVRTCEHDPVCTEDHALALGDQLDAGTNTRLRHVQVKILHPPALNLVAGRVRIGHGQNPFILIGGPLRPGQKVVECSLNGQPTDIPIQNFEGRWWLARHADVQTGNYVVLAKDNRGAEDKIRILVLRDP